MATSTLFNYFESGDLLLFSDTTFLFSRIIETFTGTPFSHVAMVLRDPILEGVKHLGLYIFESTGMSDIPDVENGMFKLGVQIRPLEKVLSEYNGRVWWRQLRTVRDDAFYNKLYNAHSKVHGVKYDLDPRDWFRVLFDIDIGNVRKTNEMYCSALVGFVYNELELFTQNDVEWTLVRPCDYSSTYSKSRISFNEKCVVAPDVLIV
jgi:hypothetical protein